MILTGANATFCNVGSMHVCWSVMDASLSLSDEIFHVSGCFIV